MQGEKFKDMARIFVLSEDLRMTRQNVASAEKITEYVKSCESGDKIKDVLYEIREKCDDLAEDRKFQVLSGMVSSCLVVDERLESSIFSIYAFASAY